MTDQMMVVLRELADANEPISTNRVGIRCGFRVGNVLPTHDGRAQGPAQRVKSSLSALERRGLVTPCWDSARKRTTWSINDKGRQALAEL